MPESRKSARRSRRASRLTPARPRTAGRRAVDVVALAAWGFGVWVLLTWTRTAEQLTIGAALSLATGLALAPLGPVAAPWRLLRPRTAVAAGGLLVTSLGRIVAANVRLAARIWSPRRPLSSGMVIVPTTQRSVFGLTVVGLVTSAVVDNQVVDVDRRRGELAYHAVAVPEQDGSGSDQAARRAREHAREAINAPVERFLRDEAAGERGERAERGGRSGQAAGFGRPEPSQSSDAGSSNAGSSGPGSSGSGSSRSGSSNTASSGAAEPSQRSEAPRREPGAGD